MNGRKSFWDKIERVARVGRATEMIVRNPKQAAAVALKAILEEDRGG